MSPCVGGGGETNKPRLKEGKGSYVRVKSVPQNGGHVWVCSTTKLLPKITPGQTLYNKCVSTVNTREYEVYDEDHRLPLEENLTKVVHLYIGGRELCETKTLFLKETGVLL